MMVMDAIQYAKSKKDGLVKEDLALEAAHVSHTDLIDHIFQQQEQSTCLAELFKVLD